MVDQLLCLGLGKSTLVQVALDIDVEELIAGMTTFLTMCYILAVNPTILATTGLRILTR